MRVNTAIGECSAEYNGVDYLVRPCFRALKQIDNLKESIKTVCYAYQVILNGGSVALHELSVCAYVLQTCSDLPDDLIGWIEESSGKYKWRKKKASVNEIVIMAHHCIKWGVFGDPKPLTKMAKKQLDEKPDRDFNPSDIVAILIDEFGLSKSDAWESTMVEFQMLCDQRQRKNQDDKEPISDDEREKIQAQYRACLARKNAGVTK